MNAKEVYDGSDGALTTRYYAALQERGPVGVIAMNLFRASKCSARAKVYRGGIKGKGRYKDMAYDRKDWSIKNLCCALAEHGEGLGIVWGWKQDPAQAYHNWVLYVEIESGQVSFHTSARGTGPDYAGEWDKQPLSAERIIAFCDSVFSQEPEKSNHENPD